MRRIKEQSGIEAVLHAVEEESAEVVPPEYQIEIWKEDFMTGIAYIRMRIRRANNKGGLAAAGITLQKTFATALGNGHDVKQIIPPD